MDLTNELRRAISARDLKRLHKCLDDGASPDTWVDCFRDFLLHLALAFDWVEGFTLLVKAGASRSTFDGGILHYACREDSTVYLRVLMDAGFDLNETDRRGNSATLISTRECCKLLLGGGASPHVPNAIGNSQLHMFAIWARGGETGTIEHARLHIEAGANVHAVDDKGRTPLHRAVHSACVPLVRMLLAAGASTHALDSRGRSPTYFTFDPDASSLARRCDSIAELDEIREMLITAHAPPMLTCQLNVWLF
jgi:ankyrin repeat protein